MRLPPVKLQITVVCPVCNAQPRQPCDIRAGFERARVVRGKPMNQPPYRYHLPRVNLWVDLLRATHPEQIDGGGPTQP